MDKYLKPYPSETEFPGLLSLSCQIQYESLWSAAIYVTALTSPPAYNCFRTTSYARKEVPDTLLSDPSKVQKLLANHAWMWSYSFQYIPKYDVLHIFCINKQFHQNKQTVLTMQSTPLHDKSELVWSSYLPVLSHIIGDIPSSHEWHCNSSSQHLYWPMSFPR